ncbi:MAG: hypothetical protein HKN72_03745 [Gemmatimonadetes bacterium]|nr:hypothetical protein [Gemmatimonadota bacterium]
MASRSINELLPDYPEIQVERVEYLTNLKRARREGVRTIPTLVEEGGGLQGFYLTKARIRAYFDDLTS